MADAGRILIIPRGDYNANSTYDKLDLVKYKGTSWLAKKNATGVEPVEGEYWQKIFDLGTANNLTTTAEGFALDARQGKILNDMLLSNYIGIRDMVSTNFNDQKENGIYSFGSNTLYTNHPKFSWGLLLVIRSGQYIKQIALGANSQDFAYRHSPNGGVNWGTWINLGDPRIIVGFATINVADTANAVDYEFDPPEILNPHRDIIVANISSVSERWDYAVSLFVPMINSLGKLNFKVKVNTAQTYKICYIIGRYKE
jgi:hypothetical protein